MTAEYCVEARTSMQTDIELIRRIGEGDASAVRQLMKRHEGRVMQLARRMVSRREEAEEVAQDTFEGALRTLPTFDPQRSSFSTWLLGIAYRKAAEHLRRRHTVLYIEEHQAAIDEADNEAAIDAVLSELTEERVQQLMEAVSTLPPAEQTLLQLRYTDDLSLAEIGAITGQSAAYTATRLQRIRRKLYHIITAQSYENE